MAEFQSAIQFEPEAVFNKQTDASKCFGVKEPEKDQTNPRKFSVACPDEAGNDVVIYEFERGSLGWKFVRLDNFNE
nr:B70 [uncultured bacterium]